jgi:hypothetical protein
MVGWRGVVMSTVNHPPHYNAGPIECIDAIASALSKEEMIGFCIGNAIKYLWRHQHKGNIEDLKKAQFYLNWIISSSEGKRGES